MAGELLDERIAVPRKTVPQIIATLREMTRDNPAQLTRLGALESIASGRMALTEQAMQRLNAGDHDGALASMEDARHLFPIANAIQDVLAEETRLLNTRRNEARDLRGPRTACPERLPRGQGYCVHVRPWAGELAREPGEAAAQINAQMERLVRAGPEQYLWGYARYKQPREELQP